MDGGVAGSPPGPTPEIARQLSADARAAEEEETAGASDHIDGERGAGDQADSQHQRSELGHLLYQVRNNCTHLEFILPLTSCSKF